jgi:hypothetical protein
MYTLHGGGSRTTAEFLTGRLSSPQTWLYDRDCTIDEANRAITRQTVSLSFGAKHILIGVSPI